MFEHLFVEVLWRKTRVEAKRADLHKVRTTEIGIVFRGGYYSRRNDWHAACCRSQDKCAAGQAESGLARESAGGGIC